jgi:hypothetical protein
MYNIYSCFSSIKICHFPIYSIEIDDFPSYKPPFIRVFHGYVSHSQMVNGLLDGKIIYKIQIFKMIFIFLTLKFCPFGVSHP